MLWSENRIPSLSDDPLRERGRSKNNQQRDSQKFWFSGCVVFLLLGRDEKKKEFLTFFIISSLPSHPREYWELKAKHIIIEILELFFCIKC
jgi:hypothetical protein